MLKLRICRTCQFFIWITDRKSVTKVIYSCSSILHIYSPGLESTLIPGLPRLFRNLFVLFFLSPFRFNSRQPLLQLLLVFCTQCVESLQLGGVAFGPKHQLLPAGHEARRVVPAVDQAQLRLLRVHRLLGHTNLVLNESPEDTRRVRKKISAKQLDLVTVQWAQDWCKPFLFSARSLCMCCGSTWHIPPQNHSESFLL